MESSSYELRKFNINGTIKLNGVEGMIKIYKSEDGKVVLFCDKSYQLIDYSGGGQAKKANTDAALAFVLDVGIEKTKWLTIGGGLYFANSLLPSAQPSKEKAQTDFDESLLKKIILRINDDFKSGDRKKEVAAVRLNYLFETYNHAWLLFPDFFNESYLSLMRIIDAVTGSRGARQFATEAAEISSTINQVIFDDVSSMSAFTNRLTIAEDLFNDQLAIAKKKNEAWAPKMEALDGPGRFVFSCMYSAYRYRNEFVHHGFPFPNYPSIGNSYLSASLGTSFIKRHRLESSQPDDYLDIHEVVSDSTDVHDFKNKFFLLLPSWEFVRLLAKEALINCV